MAIADLVYIDATGFHYPDYATVLDYYKTQYRGIYGDDVYLEPDSQDGQWLAIEAQAVYDTMNMAAAVYNAYSPSTAVGAGLSSIVKTNGIARRVATSSTVSLTLVGQVGAVINNGQARDTLGNTWILPASVTIPPEGETTVTATAENVGAVSAGVGTVTTIATPTLGWQSVTNDTAAVEGVGVELDAELRERQKISTALPSLTPVGSLQGSIASLANVVRVLVYENSTDSTDSNGLPEHSISAVVEGGDLDEIAETIGQKKTPGADTYGTTTKTYEDPTTGLPSDISFFQLAEDTITVVVTGTALDGFTTNTAADIKQAIADYINTHGIGEDVEYTGLWSPAYLNLPARTQPYRVNTLTIAIGVGVQGTADLSIAFNHAAVCTPADVTVTIV